MLSPSRRAVISLRGYDINSNRVEVVHDRGACIKVGNHEPRVIAYQLTYTVPILTVETVDIKGMQFEHRVVCTHSYLRGRSEALQASPARGAKAALTPPTLLATRPAISSSAIIEDILEKNATALLRRQTDDQTLEARLMPGPYSSVSGRTSVSAAAASLTLRTVRLRMKSMQRLCAIRKSHGPKLSLSCS